MGCITALATAIIAVFTICLWWSTRKLWKTTIRSVEATEKAADAAKASSEALPTLERAYLYVSSVNVNMENWMYAPTDQISPIKIEVSNYGRTPAKVKEIITTIQVGKSDDEGKISYGTPDIDEIIDAAGRFIARDSTEEFDRHIHILSLVNGLVDEWHGIGVGKYHIGFSGEVRYKDIFEKDHIAYFNWCLISTFNRGFYINNPELNYTT